MRGGSLFGYKSKARSMENAALCFVPESVLDVALGAGCSTVGTVCSRVHGVARCSTAPPLVGCRLSPCARCGTWQGVERASLVLWRTLRRAAVRLRLSLSLRASDVPSVRLRLSRVQVTFPCPSTPSWLPLLRPSITLP